MGNIFRKLRSRYDTDTKDFTARELSRKISLSPKVISVLENKETNCHEPTLTELKEYHKEFNVPYEYLLGESESDVYEHQTVSKELGLSGKAVEMLQCCKKYGGGSIIRTINTLLEEETTLLAIRQYLFYKICGDIAPFKTEYMFFGKDDVQMDEDDIHIIDTKKTLQGLTTEKFKKIEMLEIQECLMKLLKKVNLEEDVDDGKRS